jgi:leader peptidase (prepilin peptidase)/N-methyltransferase
MTFTPEVWIAALFGLILGSFLNVCIYRLPLDLALAKPSRSFCPACLGQIPWYDNIPLLSWLMLGRKCRRCRSAISWRYPAVEALTAIAFALAIAKHGATLEGCKLCLFAFLMIGCIFTDLEQMILPDEFTFGGIAAGLTLACLHPLPEPKLLPVIFWKTFPGQFTNLLEAAAAAALPPFLIWAMGEIMTRVLGRDALGFGDVKMVSAIGAFYGLIPTLSTVLIGSLLGSAAGAVFIWILKRDRRTFELPFGSFLGSAALAVQYWLR